ncbi:MAG TPA: hypothetical protein VND93_15995 [Myxococcales bacterium]|nr:hypothetical protein [Myxococcales bacterium]
MEGEIVTLRGHSELRFSSRLDLVTGAFRPDGSVALWIQEWKPRFGITPLQVREGDVFSTAGHRFRVVELNAHFIRPYVRLEVVVAAGMQKLLPEPGATRPHSQPTMM